MPAAIALYVLNHKRQRLTDIEARYAMKVNFSADESLLQSQPRIDRLRAQTVAEPPPRVIPAETAYEVTASPADDADIENDDDDAENNGTADATDAAGADSDAPVPGETAEEG